MKIITEQEYETHKPEKQTVCHSDQWKHLVRLMKNFTLQFIDFSFQDFS